MSDAPKIGQADDELIDLVRRMQDAKANGSAWNDIASKIREELIEHAQSIDPDAEVLIGPGGVKVVTIKETARHIFDKDAFKRAHPDIDLDEYQKVSSSVTVRVGNI